jgi:hypothetical protein
VWRLHIFAEKPGWRSDSESGAARSLHECFDHDELFAEAFSEDIASSITHEMYVRELVIRSARPSSLRQMNDRGFCMSALQQPQLEGGVSGSFTALRPGFLLRHGRIVFRVTAEALG